MKGHGMDWQFGYNCRHFVPTLGKCRMKIDRYNQRRDLLAIRVMKTQEILVYAGWSPQELMDRVEQGEVDVRRVKKPKNPERDGYLRFRINCSSEWDDCGTGDRGGMCGMCSLYTPHDGAHITCFADLRGWKAAHPNMASVPSDEDVKLIEGQLFGLVVEEELAPSDT